MKLARLIKADLFFLAKYGIFLVYAIFVAVYVAALHYISKYFSQETVIFVMKLLVFSDPAAMGLFFMGAVVLLEKSQRVNCSIAVSPVTTGSYVLSKAAAFMAAGVTVALAISWGSGHSLTLPGIAGVAGASMLFSMAGLFSATKAGSLNQFIIFTLPVEILVSTPAFLLPFGKLKSVLWTIHPGVAAMRLLFSSGGLANGGLATDSLGTTLSATGNSFANLAALASLAAWNTAVFFLAKKAADKMFRKLGGGSL